LNLQQPKWRGPAARNSAARLVVPRSTRQYKPQNTDSMEKYIQQKSMDAQQNPSDEDRRAKLEQQIRAMAAIKAAAPSHFRASFAREPQFGSGNPDYMANQTQHRSIAARQDLSDEDCRAEHFGNWLEDLPKLPDNIEHRLIQSGHNARHDTEFRGNQLDGHDRGDASTNQFDGISFDPLSREVPTRTKSESDLLKDKFSPWAARKREEFRQTFNARTHDGA
jgi:hypothetical protein